MSAAGAYLAKFAQSALHTGDGNIDVVVQILLTDSTWSIVATILRIEHSHHTIDIAADQDVLADRIDILKYDAMRHRRPGRLHSMRCEHPRRSQSGRGPFAAA